MLGYHPLKIATSIEKKLVTLPTLIFALLLAASFITYQLYWPGLFGPFLLDDAWNLSPMGYDNGLTTFPRILEFVLGNQSGPLGRPISMLSFMINDNSWPSSEYDLKRTNLMIHIMCGFILFSVLQRIFSLSGFGFKRAYWFSLFAVSLWWVHPLNVSSVLYVIQRMTQLAMLFSLCALWFYLVARERIKHNASGGYRLFLLGVLPCITLSVLSKENGILTCLFIILIELLFYNGKKDFVFSWFFRIFCIAPVVLCFTYLLYKNWNFDLVYARRDFSLEERLMTQARALCDYVYLILVPQTIGSGLIHDDFRVSRSLIEPLTTIFSLGAVGAAILLSFLVKKRYPLLAFGVLFFLAGHSLESTFLPLENYFEHRNYLPMVGVLLVIVFILNALVSNLSKKLAIGLSAMVCTFYFIFASLLTSQNTRVWSNTFDLLTIWATEHPDSLRAQRIYGQFLGKTDMWHYEGADVLLDAYQKFPRDIGLLIAAANISCKHGYDKPIVELQYILDELNKPEKLARFNGGLLTIVENFGDLYLVGKCDTEANQRVVDQILTSLVGLSGFNAGTRAELSVYHSETFAKRGDLDGAITLLDEAFNYQRASVIPVQQAIYFSSAGLYDEALERLDVAIKINQDRSSIEVFDSASDHLLRMQNDIKSAKQRITVE